MKSIRDNARIAAFLDQLEAAGVSVRTNWQAESGGAIVTHVRFVGDGFTPAIGTAVILDYGENGYALYVESQSNSIAKDVHSIARRQRIRCPCRRTDAIWTAPFLERRGHSEGSPHAAPPLTLPSRLLIK